MKDEEKKEKEKPKSEKDDVDMDDYSAEQAIYEAEIYDKYGEDVDVGEGESDSHHSDENEILEAERQAAYDVFKESTAKRIKDSTLGEDQQLMLVKLMARQHGFLVGYLHSYAEGERDEDRGEDHGEEDYSGMLNEDEVYLLQCRIDDFQQCLEEVEERYFLLRAGGKPKSEEPKPVPEDK